VTLSILSDGCQVPAELDVSLGLSTPSSGWGLWDSARWDTATFGPDIVWESVSDSVRSLQTSRGFSRGWGFWSAGTITVVLNNIDGRFSPDNLDPAAPYVVAGVSAIRPGIPIRVTLTYLGVVYPVFYGYVTSWGDGVVEHGPRRGDAFVQIEGHDEWGRLSKTKGAAVSPLGAGDTFNTRINRILSAAGFAGTVDADTGYVTFQATDLSDDPIDELNGAAETEGGAVWAEADGSIVARDRYSLVEDQRSVVPVQVFGDCNPGLTVCWLGVPWTCPAPDSGEVPWASIDIAPLTDDNIVNRAVCTPAGGTPQTATDPASIAIYGIRDGEDKSDLPCQTDSQALALAQWIVLTKNAPEARVDRISLFPQCDLARLLPLLMGIRIRDLVKIVMRPPTDYALHEFVRYCHVSGIAISIAGNKMEMRFDLESASAFRSYALSRWDVGLWGDGPLDPTGARFFI
jgi:hypothetical protein